MKNLEIMTAIEFKKKQEEITNDVLIMLGEKQIQALAKTGGRSHKMCVPPEITDTDMLFSEILNRFKSALANER